MAQKPVVTTSQVGTAAGIPVVNPITQTDRGPYIPPVTAGGGSGTMQDADNFAGEIRVKQWIVASLIKAVVKLSGGELFEYLANAGKKLGQEISDAYKGAAGRVSDAYKDVVKGLGF